MAARRGGREPAPASPALAALWQTQGHLGCSAQSTRAGTGVDGVNPEPGRAHSQAGAQGLRLPPHYPIIGMPACPQGQSRDKSFLLRAISTTTSPEQCPLPSSQPPEPPVLCQPNPKGHYCSNRPGEQCEVLCGSIAARCPADSGLLLWGSRLLSQPDSQPRMPLLLPALHRNPQWQPLKHLPT